MNWAFIAPINFFARTLIYCEQSVYTNDMSFWLYLDEDDIYFKIFAQKTDFDKFFARLGIPSLLSIWGQNMDFIVRLMDHLSFREFSQTKYPHICKYHKSANHSSWWDLCQRKIWMIYCSIHWKQDFEVINLSIMIYYDISN